MPLSTILDCDGCDVRIILGGHPGPPEAAYIIQIKNADGEVFHFHNPQCAVKYLQKLSPAPIPPSNSDKQFTKRTNRK
jgi:hypothetical protein